MEAKIGIALSGGGARGIAHIGVLAALERNGIRPDLISGTSMGALVGVFYAAGYNPNDIFHIINSRKLYRVFRWAFLSNGILDMKQVEVVLRKHIGIDSFSVLQKPFYCTVANLNTGKVEYVSKGRLFPYVIASASIPIVFEPQIIDGQTYVDGGLLSNLPVQPLLGQVTTVLGVHVNHNSEVADVKGIKNIAERCFRLAIGQNARDNFGLCDYLIDPPQIRDYGTFDFHKTGEIYKIGFDETERFLANLNTEELHRLQKKEVNPN